MKGLLNINESHLYLSKERSLYIGRVGEQMCISKAPAVFLMSLDGDISFELNDETFCVQSVVLSADTSIELALGNSLIAIFFLDFLGADFSILEKNCLRVLDVGKRQILLDPELTEPVLKVVSEAYLSRPSAELLFKRLESLVSVDRAEMLKEGYFIPDERIVKSIRFIRSPAGLGANVEKIASHVSLSVPRFTQLFRSVTGISLRRFKIWYRMYLASERLAKGGSFTEAAVAAGFSDYAHFSRSFTEMGGVAPSVMLYGSQDLYLDVYYRLDQTKAEAVPTLEQMQELAPV